MKNVVNYLNEPPGRAVVILAVCLTVVLLFNGCVVCSADRVFPKIAWRWSTDGKRELESRRGAMEFKKAYDESLIHTNR
jgi:hypothetical protein